MSALLTSARAVRSLQILCLLWAAMPLSALAGNLEDIRFAELPGERFEVRMSFSEAPSAPAGYTIEQPARIVLDFPNVNNLLSQKKFPLSFGNAKSAVILSGGGRTRLILNLGELTPYRTRVEGNAFVVEVGSTQVADYIEKSGSLGASLSSDISRHELSVSNIDFRRGENGEGKIIITLSSPNVNVDVEEGADGIELNFMNTQLPQELRRRLDVTDFATPVSSIKSDYDGSKTSIKIAPTGDYDYLAYQADTEYVVSVKPLTSKELEEKKARFAFVGDKLSLNFQDIEVRSVLQLIADFTELNLVASDTVSGRITLRLDNVPWDQALDLVLKTKGLDKRQVGNVLMVAPAAEIAERERQELETHKQLQELAPLRTEYIRVRYANAKELFKLFDNQQGSGGRGGSSGQGASTASILSERGQAIVDERTNSIILTDTQEKINEFKVLIDKIDIPIRQVMIEARIVIANTDFRKELGATWGVEAVKADTRTLSFTDPDTGLTTTVDQLTPQGTQLGIGGSRNFNEGTGLAAGDFFVTDPASGLGEIDTGDITAVDLGVTNPAASLAFSLLTSDTFIDLELSALQNSGYVEIVSQPKVITGDKQKASIESGTEIPYQEASASGATTTSFKEAVLKLDVTPQITPDDRIIMDLKINQDSPGEIESISRIPTIDVTEVNTQVLVGNGQTVVLGGIFTNTTIESSSKVPLLGDIPYLGRLFRKDINSEEKRELLIFITPKILAESITN